MVFVGQEFGMCLGIVVGMQVGKYEQGQLGARQACLCWCSLQEFPGGNPYGLIWASSEHAASGSLDNVYSDSGSSKCSSEQSEGCIPFFKQASKTCCHFFLILLVKDSHKPAQKAGKIDPLFSMGKLSKSHWKIVSVTGDTVATILENTICPSGPSGHNLYPSHGQSTSPSAGLFSPIQFFMVRVAVSRTKIFYLNHVHVWIKLFACNS